MTERASNLDEGRIRGPEVPLLGACKSITTGAVVVCSGQVRRIVWPMVIRILRTTVRPERANAFRERALAKAADARKVPGVIDVHVGNQAGSADYQFVFISRWESIDALYAWAGGRDLLARPTYFDGLQEAVIDFDIQHYVDVESTDQP